MSQYSVYRKKPNPLWAFLARLCVNAFRIATFSVVAMLVFFPAFKGVWLGFVPVLLGGLAFYYGRRFIHPASMSLARWSEASYLSLLLLLPAAIQVVLIVLFRSQPTFDGLFVYREAVTLVETGRMNPLTYYAPGQVWYFALFFHLFGTSPLVAQLCQIPLMMLIAYLVYQIAKAVSIYPDLNPQPNRGPFEIQAGPGRARLAGLFTAFYPGLLLYILVTPYYYYLYTVMLLLMVWAWLRMFSGEGNVWSSIWGGVAAGCGALTKATFLVAPAQALCFAFLASERWINRRSWSIWILFLAIMSITIAPWVLRNQRMFGETVLINTAGPLVLFSANNPESDGLYSDIPDQVDLQTPQDMLDHMEWCSEQAKIFIRENPSRFIQLIGLKLIHTWGTETTFVELINRNRRSLGPVDPAMRFAVQSGWALLVFSWGAVAWQSFRRRRAPRPFELAIAILVLSKFLIYSVYEGGARHHMPVIPLLWIYVMMYRPSSRSATT